jgi:hypothetical protein
MCMYTHTHTHNHTHTHTHTEDLRGLDGERNRDGHLAPVSLPHTARILYIYSRI